MMQELRQAILNLLPQASMRTASRVLRAQARLWASWPKKCRNLQEEKSSGPHWEGGL
jgi:hypothetical protein